MDPTAPKRFRNKGQQDYSVLTINGRLVLRRTRWHSPLHGSIAIIDAYLDQTERTISVGVREMACRLNASSANFDLAAENLQRTAQIHTSGETLRNLVEAEGRKVIKAQQQGKLPITWSATDCSTRLDGTVGPARVYLGSDGVQIPMVSDQEKKARRKLIRAKRRRCGRKCRPLPRAKVGTDQRYKEFKIVTYYDETQAHRIVAGTKNDHHQAGRLMRQLASHIHLNQAPEKIGIVDGAPWISNQIKRQNIPLDSLGLDFYHLAENVHEARRAIYGEQSEPGQIWVSEVLHSFRHEGYVPTLSLLSDWHATLSEEKQKPAGALLNYVKEREKMICYPEFAEKGWQIGSGPTESMCKVLTRRIKGSGMRWDGENAEAVMALESLFQSGMWNAYWQSDVPRAA